MLRFWAKKYGPGWMDGWIDGWMGRWMRGWVDGWVDVWMDGWVVEPGKGLLTAIKKSRFVFQSSTLKT